MLVDLFPSHSGCVPAVTGLPEWTPLNSSQQEWHLIHTVAVTVLKASAAGLGGRKSLGVRGTGQGTVQSGEGTERGTREKPMSVWLTVTSISACGNNSLMVSLLFLPVQLCNVRGAPLGSNDLGSFYNNNLSLYIQEEWPKGSKLKSLKCFFPLIYMMFTTAGAEKMWDLDSL